MKHTVVVSGLVASIAGMVAPYAYGQAGCKPLTGTVEDTTAAVIPGATVTLDQGTGPASTRQSGSDGRFRFACVAPGSHRLAAQAQGFALTAIEITAGTAETRLVLLPSTATVVDVSAEAPEELAGTGGLQGSTVQGTQLQQLADDPDDLERELQQMAAAAGGTPGGTTISVDGFQDDAKLPPKSSIAFIRVNPDLFSAEYREPPFEGGRVEIFTKPGASTFHGALFATNSSPGINARDPFSVSKAAIGKQRYGFEFNGPIRRQGSNFTMTLEHRSIDNFAVVNAVTLDDQGNAVNTIANVATPQRLWVGTARVDWQLGPKNIAFLSYSANVNHLANVGVGGTSLAETGYDSGRNDHIIRFSNVTTVSPRLVHEARVSLDWRYENDVPVSTAPQVQVAGSFTGGGSTAGRRRFRELRVEWDDDVIVTTKRHLIKAGWQLLPWHVRLALPDDFNGTYLFGGGPAPLLGANPPAGQTTVISGLEQYRRAKLGLAGGTPTQFSGVAGNPEVDFNQIKLGLFLQDDWKLKPNLTLSLGLRYYLQNDPLVLNGTTPRLGVSWSPDKKKKWNLNAHAGLFTGLFSLGDYSELQREDGVQRVTSLVYNPVYLDPLAHSPTVLHAKRTAPGLTNLNYAMVTTGVSRNFAHGWNLNGSFLLIGKFNDIRTVNVNAPLDGQPNGPRPFGANLNILQVQNSGRGSGDLEVAGISNRSFKRLQFYFGALRNNIRDDTDDDIFHTPQNSFSNAGELARRTNNGLWQTYGDLSLKLPEKVQLSANYYGAGNRPYNLTTGFDNNGDGNFNDRPQFATPGQTGAVQAGAVQTQYGLLVASGGTGALQRNLGNLPWSFNLDMNVQRAFTLTRDPKADHKQTLTANVRSSNVLNHLNAVAAGGVLGSPLFGRTYAADNGRRVEGGLRYNF